MSRRLAREAALRVLFQVEVGRSSWQDALTYNSAELGLSEPAQRFAGELVQGTLEHLGEVDQKLAQYSVDWRVDRMPSIDRNILRMATYELLYHDDTPPGVAVNEAVELAKVYGDANSGRFVNGILGNLVRIQS